MPDPTSANPTGGLAIASLHHVSLPVTDLDLSRAFYREVLGLAEIARPAFDFPGAWFAIGAGGQQLHLIGPGASTMGPTFRASGKVDSRDIHFAVRVGSFTAALTTLRGFGYSEDASDDRMRMRVNARATAGFPQIYIVDPDRHVIEINAERLDQDGR